MGKVNVAICRCTYTGEGIIRVGFYDVQTLLCCWEHPEAQISLYMPDIVLFIAVRMRIQAVC